MTEKEEHNGEDYACKQKASQEAVPVNRTEIRNKSSTIAIG